MRGDDLALPEPESSLPDDVRLLYAVLNSKTSAGQTVNTDNCGTAMRFLTAWFAQEPGCEVVLDGSARMRERPIGQLVDALRELGADIAYFGNEGFPPIRICGKELKRSRVYIENPQSTQFVSALLLVGIDAETNISSPYIDMTRSIVKSQYQNIKLESDWSSAAFWYEYVALNGGELLLEGLSMDSLQGDKVVTEIFRRLGVESKAVDGGILISRNRCLTKELTCDFSTCPDLYPPVYATCRRLGVKTCFSGLESLPLKESNRLQAMDQLSADDDVVYKSYGDHRVAMSLIVAGCKVDDEDCISKSYPDFLKQWKALR